MQDGGEHCGHWPVDRAAIEAALRRMDERRKTMSLKGLSLRDLIDEGRP